MKIYCAHAISGLGAEEVLDYYKDIQEKLRNMKFDVLHPMTGKGYMRTETKFKAHGYKDNPVSTNHAIKERDKWMVQNCDILLCDLSGTKVTSIGCVSEIAWGDLLGKHVLVVMEKENIHRHAFVIENADIIFETMVDALDYLNKLSSGDI